MAKKKVTEKVRQEVQQIVDRFNRDELGQLEVVYSLRFRGAFLYLDRDDGFGPGPICRLEYNGDMKQWGFAIFKYSTDRYDPEECFFPGEDLIDGTIEGAMRAGMKAYD